MKNIAVIFAGGSGVRMNTRSKPKQFLELRGKPIIIYTLELFDNHPLIDGIVVVCLESWIPFLKKMLKKFEINKVVKIVSGGDSGQDSIYRGLCAVEDYCKDKGEENAVVLIHDGVRPLIVDETITRNIEKVHEKGSANCRTCHRNFCHPERGGTNGDSRSFFLPAGPGTSKLLFKGYPKYP